MSLALAVGAGLFFVQTLRAVHDTGAFELDGDATSGTATPPSTDDWDHVFHGTSTAAATSFTAEPDLQATIFTGGGSKDPIDINQWAWKDGAGGLPDKDNLLDSFAARYSLTPTQPGGSCPNGTGDLNGDGNIVPPEVVFNPNLKCEVLYFGSDRFDNSGDAQQGFWFFQNQITLGDQKLGGGFNFKGVHANGDLLIISDFSNGGTVSTITVYVWDSTVNGNLRLLQTSTAANCLTAGPGDAFCGIVNPGPGLTTAPWDFTDKSGNNHFANGEFYEGGVNLSLLGLADECFASASSETRSSTSTTATLKDFVLGQFASCTATLTTTPSPGAGGTVARGASVTDTAIVQGAGTSSPPTPTGNVTFFLCGPIASGTCTTGGNQVGQPVALADSAPPAGEATAISAAVNTAQSPLSPGRYCFRAEWPGDTNYPTPLTHAGANNSECFVVQDSTGATSAQTWLPNDSATITSVGGSALNGTLSFTLYSGDNCGVTSGGILKPAENITLTNAASPVTRSTTNSTVSVTTSMSTSWLVVFSSTDTNVIGSMKCEKTTLSITN